MVEDDPTPQEMLARIDEFENSVRKITAAGTGPDSSTDLLASVIVLRTHLAMMVAEGHTVGEGTKEAFQRVNVLAQLFEDRYSKAPN